MEKFNEIIVTGSPPQRIKRMRKNSFSQVAQKGPARLCRAPLEASIRKPIRYKASETGNPPRRGGTERCRLREEIPRNEGNPAVGGIDGPFCSPKISSHSHSFGAVPGFSNLLMEKVFEGLLHTQLGEEGGHDHPHGRTMPEGVPGPGEDPSPGKSFLHDPAVFRPHGFRVHSGVPEDNRLAAVMIPAQFGYDPALGQILLIDRAPRHGGQGQDHGNDPGFIAEIKGSLIGFQGVFVPTHYKKAHNFYAQTLQGPDVFF